MYGLYFLISLALRCLWKKLILSGRIRLYNAKKIPLFVIGTSANIAEIIENASSGDFEKNKKRSVGTTKFQPTVERSFNNIYSIDSLIESTIYRTSSSLTHGPVGRHMPRLNNDSLTPLTYAGASL